jgi:hypothetical protein
MVTQSLLLSIHSAIAATDNRAIVAYVKSAVADPKPETKPDA